MRDALTHSQHVIKDTFAAQGSLVEFADRNGQDPNSPGVFEQYTQNLIDRRKVVAQSLGILASDLRFALDRSFADQPQNIFNSN